MGKKNEENSRKISEVLFMRITRKKAKERINNEFKRYIKKEEKAIGEKLSKEEIKTLRKDFIATRGKEIREEEARKARVKATVLAFATSLGIVGIGGYSLGTRDSKIPGITDGGHTIEIDMGEVKKDVEIENVLGQEKEDKHEVFVKELQEKALNEDVENINELEQKTRQEIEQLKTPTEVLDYVKKIYVDRYNSTHEEQIGIENVILHKSRLNKVFYEDEAQNGDEILRRSTEAEIEKMGLPIGKVDKGISEISVSVETENGRKEESVAYHDGKFVKIYDEDEEVLANKETILSELGDVVFQGIDKSTSMKEENTLPDVKDKYKERFIQAVINYRESRGENVNENYETQTEQSQEDTENEIEL